jgi:S-formylglutathione hydrolase FrmB
LYVLVLFIYYDTAHCDLGSISSIYFVRPNAMAPSKVTNISLKSGHSMGGHGALTLYLASLLTSTSTGSAPQHRQYRSASAFAPIAHPLEAPWGKKAFGGYLQGGVEEAEASEQYDATQMIPRVPASEPVHILVDYVNLIVAHPEKYGADQEIN